MSKKSKSKKNRSMEFPPRENNSEVTPMTGEVNEYEAMRVNSRHNSGVQVDNITEVVTTEADMENN